MPIFVTEVQGDSGSPYENKALAATDAEDIEEAHDFLVPAVRAMNRKLFEAGAPRWDEVCPTLTREALPEEAARWKQRQSQNRPRPSPVVWLIDVDPD
jgi:hypothetical protein